MITRACPSSHLQKEPAVAWCYELIHRFRGMPGIIWQLCLGQKGGLPCCHVFNFVRMIMFYLWGSFFGMNEWNPILMQTIHSFWRVAMFSHNEGLIMKLARFHWTKTESAANRSHQPPTYWFSGIFGWKNYQLFCSRFKFWCIYSVGSIHDFKEIMSLAKMP